MNPTEDLSEVRTRPRGFSRPAVASIADPQERIRQILADRSTLGRVRLMARDQWVKKELRPNCVFCERRFRAFSRKLHCRACGEVVCSSCNRKRDVQVSNDPRDTLPVRLCFDCIDQALTPNEDLEATVDESGVSASNCAETSSCSSHMKFADGLIDSCKSTSSGGTVTDSLTRLELSSVCGDSDRESSYGYDSDDTYASEDEGDSDMDAWEFGERVRRLSTTKFYGDVDASPNSNASSASTVSSTRSGTLGFVPEEASFGDFAGEMELAIEDLENGRRAALLKQYNIEALDRQQEFDAICQLVSRALNCGVAAVGFMGETAQWYKAKIGISQSQLPRDVAFCSQVLQSKTPTIVMDASKDRRFRHNPLVAGTARIRFYASTPVCDPVSKLVLGSVFVMDPQPKSQLPSRSLEVLAYASKAVERLLQQSQKPQKTKSHTSQPRMRRVFSAPTLAEPLDDDEDDGDYSVKPDSLWTSEPEPSHRRRKSSGVTLLDSDFLIQSLKSFTKRSSKREGESESATVSPKHSTPLKTPPMAPPPSPGICEDLLQQIETTQQLLSSFRGLPVKRRTSSGGVQLLPPTTTTEVEV